MSESDFTSSEYPPLSDVLANHLTGCEQCKQASEQARPVPNLNPFGQMTTKLCPEWFKIIAEYAKQEGKVNNIVARDEFGNEAYHR